MPRPLYPWEKQPRCTLGRRKLKIKYIELASNGMLSIPSLTDVLSSTNENSFDLDSAGRVPYLLATIAEKHTGPVSKRNVTLTSTGGRFLGIQFVTGLKSRLCTDLVRQNTTRNNINCHAQDTIALHHDFALRRDAKIKPILVSQQRYSSWFRSRIR